MPKRGLLHPSPQSWKESTIRKMERVGWKKADLARRLGVSRATVGALLKSTEQSALVPRVDALLRDAVRVRSYEFSALKDGDSELSEDHDIERGTILGERRSGALQGPGQIDALDISSKLAAVDLKGSREFARMCSDLIQMFASMSRANRLRLLERAAALSEM